MHETVAKQALLSTCFFLGLSFDPEDGGSSLLLIFGERLPNGITSQKIALFAFVAFDKVYAILVLTHWSVFLVRAVLHSGEPFLY
jgi:hypothetical protein